MAERVFPSHDPRLSSASDSSETVAYVAADGDDLSGTRERSTIAGGRFQPIRPHARGGLGEVWVAFDRELKRPVALKELSASLAHDPDAQARFQLEAEITGSLDHPGIVAVYSLGKYADGRPYYAMHLVEGETLRIAIERFHETKDPTRADTDRELAFRRLLRCVIDACNAVAYAHSRGVIHRDLKPENIMLGRYGETLVVDWGVAKRLIEDRGDPGATFSGQSALRDLSLTQPGALMGTPRYMSPEQAAGDLDRVTPASDIYSLGAILYCVLVGQDPFVDGDMPSILGRVTRGIFPTPRRLVRGVEPALEAICLKAMALDPLDRHGSALELAGELETWLADVRYRREHELALSQVKATLARLCMERAHTCFDRGTQPEGMLWLARALENTPTSPPELDRVIRTSLTAWHTAPKLLERSLRHGAAVHALAFCPEGRRLATAGQDSLARLWDLATGSMLAPTMRHGGPVHAVALSPDGTLVATAAQDGAIRRWDAWTGAPRGEPTRSSARGAISFSPDGSMIGAPCGRNETFLRHAITGEPAYKYESDAREVLAVAFSRDATTVAVAHDNGAVVLREFKSGRPKTEPLMHATAVRLMAFSASGEVLLTASAGGDVQLVDLGTGSVSVAKKHDAAFRFLAFRPGDAAFATIDDNGGARLWETATGRPIGEPLGERSKVNCLAFRPDGTMVATGSADGTVRLWCAITGLPIGPPLNQGGSVSAVAFSPDGRRLAAGGSDPTVRCWKVPGPIEGNAGRVSSWVGVITELEFDAGDAIRRMDGTTTWDLRRRLDEQGGAPLR